jgi:Outer membrane protein and related peptidoglycan-associated (lipo)proteins
MIAQGEYGNPVVPVYLFPPGDDFSKVQVYERYDAGRNFKTQFWPYDFIQSMQNPYWITEHQKWQNAKTRLMGSAQLSYKPFKWLTVSARAKYDRTDEKQEQKFDASTNTLFTEGSKHGKYGLNNQYTEQKFAEVLATFNKYFGDNVINVTGVVGANVDDVTFRTDYINGPLAQVNNKFDLNNIDRNSSHTNLGTGGWRYQNQSVFANAQVGWRSRIYLDMTYRVDWNSTLWAAGAIPYPTVGLSGILTELIPGLKSSFFPYWKVRASYSEVGNTPDPADHVFDPRYAQVNGNISTDIRRRNKDLDPERTKSWEVGTNIHFFDSKLQIDATWYNANTFNQFYTARLSSTSTNSEMILNGGQVNNRGVELSVRFDDSVGKFNYGTYLTWTWNRNKIIDLSFVDPVDKQVYGRNGISVGGFGGVRNVLYEGGTLGDVYVTTIATDEHGFYRLNNEGMILPDYDEHDMIFAGSTDAKYRLSWGGHLGWGGLTAGFLFTARLGGVAISKTQAVMDYYGVSQDTADAREKGWFEFNGMKTSDVQGYYQVLGRDSGVMSQYVYDATNVRLAEVSLGYDFPVKNWGWVRGLNLSVVGNNLAMIFLKAPFDPEMTASAGTYNQGIDYFMQPSTRSLGFSVKLRFGGSTAAKAAPAAPAYQPSEPKVIEKVVEKIVEKVVEKEVVKEVKVPVGNAVTTYNDDLYFIIGKSEIRPEEAFKLGRICQVLAENPDAKITVTGYADSGTGTDEINRELSEQRAAKVVDMLVNAGISRDRISRSSVAGDRDASRSPESNRVAVCIVK